MTDHKAIREAARVDGDYTMVEVSDLRALLADLEAMRGLLLGIRQQDYLDDTYRARIDALAAISEAKAGGWLPIETAPKDGARFLAWRKHATRPLIARYWKDFDWFEDEDGVHLYHLTHWQPLPTPPKDPA